MCPGTEERAASRGTTVCLERDVWVEAVEPTTERGINTLGTVGGNSGTLHSFLEEMREILCELLTFVWMLRCSVMSREFKMV